MKGLALVLVLMLICDPGLLEFADRVADLTPASDAAGGGRRSSR